MKIRALLMSAVASVALAGTANAGHFNGWYIGVEAGANWIDDADAIVTFETIEEEVAGPETFDFDTGWAVFATVGHAFASHWRLEGELGYRSNEITLGAAEVTEWSLMLNALYDIDLSPRLSLSLGAGVGYDHATLDLGGEDDSDGNVAYQGIAGLSYAVGRRTDLTLTYRYLVVEEPAFAFTDPESSLTFDLDNVNKHSVTVGLRYDLHPDEEPAVAPPPPPPPAPPPPPPKSFVIFFGFAKCNITGEADAVLSEAAASAKASGSATVRIVGHTDTVGSPRANQKLSECRADATKSNLVGKGIPAGAISAAGKGESALMVQTGDGVKEPQNRRATVDLN
jgi:OmpA-OmpF porin, OOP family